MTFVNSVSSSELFFRIVEDNSGNIWVFWPSGGNRDIWYNRYIRNSDSWEEEDTPLTTATNHDDQLSAVTDDTGNIWLFWRRREIGNGDIWYDRFVAANNSWDGELQLTTSSFDDRDPFALRDSNGDIWLFWTRVGFGGNMDIWYNHFASGAWLGEAQRTFVFADDYLPFAVEDSQGDIWLFYKSYRNSNHDIWSNHYIRASDTWDGDTQLTFTSEVDFGPFALAAGDGGIWLFWTGGDDIWYKRFSDNGWGTSVQLTTAPESDVLPFAMEDLTGDIWVSWARPLFSPIDHDIFYRKLIPSI